MGDLYETNTYSAVTGSRKRECMGAGAPHSVPIITFASGEAEMKECPDCGCGMYGGFCTNCHEEIFIQEQYIELKEEVPPLIVKKCSEHISDPNRKANVKKLEE